jgi:hypothetical protein
MSPPAQPIPRPTLLSAQPLPEIPPHLRPAPSPLGVTTCIITGRLELAVVLKVTYRFKNPRRPERTELQLPLALANQPHDPLAPGSPASMKAVPELVAFTTGTDLIVRAHARPPYPVAAMKVGVMAGACRHVAKVSGKRQVDLVKGKLTFTPAEKLNALPLRYELAYGGVDREFEANVAASLQRQLDPEPLRRLGPVARDFLQRVPPIAYPRNPYGKGYALVGDARKMAGKELPNIELDDDRLTPARLWPPKPLLWPQQPLPAGFDYMDVAMFPRSAMMGLPPMAEGSLDDIAEVRRGQVPAGYCRGNAMHVEREEIPGLIHPELGRCAPIGLRLPFLRGNEPITLYGMDAAAPELILQLPGLRPVFRLPAPGKEVELEPQLFQVFMDVDKQVLCLLWGARAPWKKPLKPGESQEIAAAIKVRQISLGASPT